MWKTFGGRRITDDVDPAEGTVVTRQLGPWMARCPADFALPASIAETPQPLARCFAEFYGDENSAKEVGAL
jgi:hypothetical protein